MLKFIAVVFTLALLTLALGAAGIVAVPRLFPEAMAAFALILVLLHVMAASDQKRF